MVDMGGGKGIFRGPEPTCEIGSPRQQENRASYAGQKVGNESKDTFSNSTQSDEHTITYEEVEQHAPLYPQYSRTFTWGRTYRLNSFSDRHSG